MLHNQKKYIVVIADIREIECDTVRQANKTALRYLTVSKDIKIRPKY